MKKYLAIVLLSLYLCSTTELYQFLKVPVLIEHFIEHKADNPEMSFYGFLKLHYDHHVKDADWKTDQQLPFITHHDFPTMVFTLHVPLTIDLKEPHLPATVHKIPVYNDEFSDREVVASVWQPPKFC